MFHNWFEFVIWLAFMIFCLYFGIKIEVIKYRRRKEQQEQLEEAKKAQQLQQGQPNPTNPEQKQEEKTSIQQVPRERR